MRPLGKRRSFFAVLASSVAFAVTAIDVGDALAQAEAPARPPPDDPPDQDTEDGASNCRAFREKNARELAAFEKSQPAVRYSYPRESEFLNAPWGNFFKN